MEGTYPILMGREKVGQVQVQRCGLYYSFFCRCHLHSETICKIHVTCGGHHESLGIPAPSGDCFELHRKLPIKKFNRGKPEFWLTPKHSIEPGMFVEVYPEEPFHYISKLYDAYLEVRRSKPGVVIKNLGEPVPAPRGSDHCP